MANSIFSQTLLVLILIVSGFQLEAQEKNIDEWELPRTARDFISRNFPDQTIVRLTRDDDDQEREYEAVLGNSVKIEFNHLGFWKEVDGNNSEISTKFIPRKITEYVNQNYPSEKIGKIEKSVEKYEIELLNGLDLEFNSKGKFLRIDD